MTSLLTVSEVAALLRMHPESIRRLVREGRIPGAKKLCGSWRFNAELIAKWLL